MNLALLRRNYPDRPHITYNITAGGLRNLPRAAVARTINWADNISSAICSSPEQHFKVTRPSKRCTVRPLSTYLYTRLVRWWKGKISTISTGYTATCLVLPQVYLLSWRRPRTRIGWWRSTAWSGWWWITTTASVGSLASCCSGALVVNSAATSSCFATLWGTARVGCWVTDTALEHPHVSVTITRHKMDWKLLTTKFERQRAVLESKSYPPLQLLRSQDRGVPHDDVDGVHTIKCVHD
jgi:hypothetical protein